MPTLNRKQVENLIQIYEGQGIMRRFFWFIFGSENPVITQLRNYLQTLPSTSSSVDIEGFKLYLNNQGLIADKILSSTYINSTANSASLIRQIRASSPAIEVASTAHSSSNKTETETIVAKFINIVKTAGIEQLNEYILAQGRTKIGHAFYIYKTTTKPDLSYDLIKAALVNPDPQVLQQVLSFSPTIEHQASAYTTEENSKISLAFVQSLVARANQQDNIVEPPSITSTHATRAPSARVVSAAPVIAGRYASLADKSTVLTSYYGHSRELTNLTNKLLDLPLTLDELTQICEQINSVQTFNPTALKSISVIGLCHNADAIKGMKVAIAKYSREPEEKAVLDKIEAGQAYDPAGTVSAAAEDLNPTASIHRQR